MLPFSWPFQMSYETFGSEISKGDDLQSTGWVVPQQDYSVASPAGRGCGTWCTMRSEGLGGKKTAPLLWVEMCCTSYLDGTTDLRKWDAPFSLVCLKKREHIRNLSCAFFSCILFISWRKGFVKMSHINECKREQQFLLDYSKVKQDFAEHI